MDKKKRNVAIAVVAAVAIAGGICGGVAYANYQEGQRQIAEQDAAVDALAADYASQIEALAPDPKSESPDRAALLAGLDGLEKLAKSIEEDAGSLAYHDGGKSQYDDLLGKVAQQAGAIREWLQADYSKQLDAARIADLETEGVSREQVEESVRKLEELRALIESEAAHGVWAEGDAAKRDELAASVASGIEAGKAKLAAIEEAERQEAERQAAEAAAAAAYAGGGGYGGSGDYSGSGGSGDGGGAWYSITYGNETRYYSSPDEMWDGWAGDHPGIVHNPSNDNYDVPDSDLIGKGK